MKNSISIFPIKMRMPDDGNPAAVNVPLMAAVIETEAHLIMVDTGFPGEPDLFDSLEALHFHPTDFTTVINTHVHVDHVGNNAAFTNARIFVSRTDYDYAKKYSHDLLTTTDPVATLRHYFPHANSRRIDASAEHLLRLTRKHWRDDIVGNPARLRWIEDIPDAPEFITFLPTPGHTPGHYAVIVAGAETNFIITGDALPSRLFWKRRLHELTPRFSSELFLASKTKIENLHGIVMGGHDVPFRTKDLEYVNAKRIAI